MEPTIDFIMRQDAHVFESLKLADQKAQAIIALSAAAAYLMVEWNKGPQNPHWFLKAVRTSAVLMLLLSGGLALWAIYPPTGLADRTVEGGELTRPHYIVRLTQEEFTQKILSATDKQRAEQAASLLYARSKIREWKFMRFRWSVLSVMVSYSLVGIYMICVANLRSRVFDKLLLRIFLGRNRIVTTVNVNGSCMQNGPSTEQASLHN